MYAYLAKGYTAGHILARRILREVTGLPGLVLDCFFALFWVPDFTSYWDENSAKITYFDGTETTSVFKGLFGLAGEVMGYCIGAPIGALIGLTFYVPDLLLRGAIGLYQLIQNSIDDFAVFLGNTVLFEDLLMDENPQGYQEKAWNLGIAFIGMPLIAVPYVVAKAVGFVFPFLDLSYPIAALGALVGGLSGFVLAAFASIPLYFVDKAFELMIYVREITSNTVALIYACGNVDMDDSCCGPDVLHSEGFRAQVDHYEESSWGEILFGLKGGNQERGRNARATSANQPAYNGYQPPMQAPTYYTPMFVPSAPQMQENHYSSNSNPPSYSFNNH